MRAVMVEVEDELILERRLRDIDKFDEMWDGELHMTPMPSWEHQGIEKDLSSFFTDHWEKLGEGTLRAHVGVKKPGTTDVEMAGARVPRDYRGPDIVFLLKGHEGRVKGGWVVGPPDAVLEIRSPGDETYKKLPFFHSLGVPEVIVVHRDTKATEVYVRGEVDYERVPPAADGSVKSRVLDTVFRTEAGKRGRPSLLDLRRGRLPRRRGTA